MSCDFEAADRDGVPIRCRHDTWASHIIDEHLEMQDQQGAVVTTIRDPAYIYQSSRYPNRRLLYRPFVLPAPYYQSYALVVIDYRGSGSRRTGEVVSAYSTANIKTRDILIWSKYEKP